MATLQTLRIPVQAIALLAGLTGVALVSAGILMSPWQTYDDPSIPEIHQHGLWIDCYYGTTDTAGSGAPHWTCKYKFGRAVVGDPSHEAKDYQINTLVLLCVSVVAGLSGLLFSCCACRWPCTVIGWILEAAIATLLSGVAIAYFYVTCMDPTIRYIVTTKRLEVYMGTAFYLAGVGVGMFAINTVLAIASAFLICMDDNKNTRNTSRTFPGKTMTLPAHQGHNTTV